MKIIASVFESLADVESDDCAEMSTIFFQFNLTVNFTNKLIKFEVNKIK